eukprot:GHVQ01042511.1.p1 GENE.GHVQ01042511.1~~GHVQ01042511.1.p1  ORF type:complete len:379 (-),score=85.50 GHVQ01042511.1:217-1353(-)
MLFGGGIAQSSTGGGISSLLTSSTTPSKQTTAGLFSALSTSSPLGSGSVPAGGGSAAGASTVADTAVSSTSLFGPQATSLTRASSLRPVVTGTLSTETEYYLLCLCRKLLNVEEGVAGDNHIYFTVSSVSPEVDGSVKHLPSNLGGGAVSAVQWNALLEQQIVQTGNADLLARFVKAKHENPDITRIFIVLMTGCAGLKKREQYLKKTMALMSSKSEQLAIVAKKHKARIQNTQALMKSIQLYNKTLRRQVIYVMKLLEEYARRHGQVELNEFQAHKNAGILSKLDEVFKIGIWDMKLCTMAGFIQKLKDLSAESDVTQNCLPFDETTSEALRQIIHEQKNSIYSLQMSLQQLSPGVEYLESATGGSSTTTAVQPGAT